MMLIRRGGLPFQISSFLGPGMHQTEKSLTAIISRPQYPSRVNRVASRAWSV
jgi:hypothetical protein